MFDDIYNASGICCLRLHLLFCVSTEYKLWFIFCRDNVRHKKLMSLRNAPKARFVSNVSLSVDIFQLNAIHMFVRCMLNVEKLMCFWFLEEMITAAVRCDIICINSINTFTQEDYVIIVFCLFVSNFVQKLLNRFAWNFQGRLAMGQWTND